MSNKKRSIKHSITFDGFRGADHTNRRDKRLYATDMINFRICKDGSLAKRPGFRMLTDIGDTIRAFHLNMLNGKQTFFVLAGTNIYSVDLSTGDRTTVGSVSSSSGDAAFIFYQGSIFLIDGHHFYEYLDGVFKETEGYVPLVAKDWPNNIVGAINEPRNILNPHARLTFVVGDPSSMFLCTKYPVASIEALYLNNTLLNKDKYYIDNNFTTVNVPGLVTGDRVEIHLTYTQKDEDLYSKLCSSRFSAIFGGEHNRLFLCGGDNAGLVFPSEHISKERLELSQKHFPASNALYFPDGNEFKVGDGMKTIRGIARHYDRLLMFTEGDVWMAAPDASGKDECPTTCINSELGCSSLDGVTLMGNDPVSLGNHAIWKWTDETDILSKCNAVSISDSISDKFKDNHLQKFGVFYDHVKDELWVYRKGRNGVWVYNPSLDSWYEFENIYADVMFEADGKVGFIKDGMIFFFIDGLTHDIEADGSTSYIVAEYMSKDLDFSTHEMKKLISILLRANLNNNTVKFALLDKNFSETACSISEENSSGLSIINRRFRSDRFIHTRFTLSLSGLDNAIIHGITLNTR